MLKAAEFFVGGQQLVRLNEKVIGEVSRDHGINATELSILLFLAGNPDLNTAKDIVESRLMTKSSVSRPWIPWCARAISTPGRMILTGGSPTWFWRKRLPRSSSWSSGPAGNALLSLPGHFRSRAGEFLPHPHPDPGKCPGSHEGLWNKK